MIENERIVNARKRNMKLYPIYKTISFDIVFVYAIKMLFLTQVKNLTPSDVILSVSMYSLFRVILQFPATMLINKIGYKKCTILSNITNMFYPLLLMLSNNITILIIAEFMSAVTFALKGVAEPILLNISIPTTSKKGQIFSKLEGRASANYYYLEVITSLISGFIYVVNPYLPFILSMMLCAISAYIATKFEGELEETTEERINKKGETLKEIRNLIKACKFIIKSKRLRALIIYSGILYGAANLFASYDKTIMQDIGISATGLGIISAILSIVSGIASKQQVVFHNRFRNKTLSYIGLSCMIAAILCGGVVLLKAPFGLCVAIVLIESIIVRSDRAMYDVLIVRYLGNFSNKKVLPQIYSANAIVKNIFRSTIEILGAALIGVTSSYNSMLIAGIIGLIIMINILKYMKSRVGLKPEQYSKSDIEMKILN